MSGPARADTVLDRRGEVPPAPSTPLLRNLAGSLFTPFVCCICRGRSVMHPMTASPTRVTPWSHTWTALGLRGRLRASRGSLAPPFPCRKKSKAIKITQEREERDPAAYAVNQSPPMNPCSLSVTPDSHHTLHQQRRLQAPAGTSQRGLWSRLHSHHPSVVTDKATAPARGQSAAGAAKNRTRSIPCSIRYAADTWKDARLPA
jgi:hypothetical protein